MANGVPPAMIRIMLAQAVHETGNFQSPVFRFNNNAFGMKRPRIRKTLDLNGSSNDLLAIPEFAVFKNVEDSARDMLLYFDHFGVSMNFTDPFDYVQTLKSKGYFEDSLQNYFTGVRRAFDMLEPIS
jgi:flagellum-specific peptidoglycan hydrolase FlgJ